MAKRKKNKQSEEVLVDIVEVRDQAQSFMDRNQKTIFGALVAVVVVIGGFLAYKNLYQKPLQQEAVDQMFRAQRQFEQDSFALALTNPGGGYLGFLDIIDNYKGTKAANLSKYYVGISYLHLGKFEAAVSYLSDFNPAGDISPIMKNGALGDAHAELGNMGKAKSFYRKAANSDNEALTPYYLKKLGMLLESEGDLAGAKKLYEEVKTKYPTSASGRDIEKYIARVDK
jgi:tetratricopeptide (TPR) repeat protein